jgi:hypothetical protein
LNEFPCSIFICELDSKAHALPANTSPDERDNGMSKQITGRVNPMGAVAIDKTSQWSSEQPEFEARLSSTAFCEKMSAST